MAITLKPTSKTSMKRKLTDSEFAAIEKRIVPVLDLTDPLKMVVYSRNKVGKTRFACSSELKTLLIDCRERGTASVRKRGNVWVFRVTRWDDIDSLYWYLRSGKHDFEVTGIDTITMLAKICMKWVLKDDLERDMTKDPLLADKRSWGKMGELISDFILRFRDLPIHTLYLAQERVTATEDEDGGVTKEIHPDLSPGPRTTLLSSVGVVGRLYVKEVEVDGKTKRERRMLLGAHPVFASGNRYDELRYVERNPTLQGFLDRINSGE